MIYQNLITKSKAISITGLGYVGLPLALAFAKHFKVIAFDINAERINLMKQGIDPSKELDTEAFANTDITFTSNPKDLKQAHFHIITVPTDIDQHKVPNLQPLFDASETVANALKPGDYVIYESTTYPGCTEEDCLPILETNSDLKLGTDFKLGYSPERIVPGDKTRTITTIRKVVSGSDPEALDQIDQVYNHVITAGTYKAPSIKVAEAAKVIENTQRDLNISLMNELAIIFDRMDIDTQEVIKAAGTKWNFLKFYPGLVGGHCIGVDPYYLLHKAKELGYEPQVIASGRKVNDHMPAFVAKTLVQKLIEKGKNPSQCKVLVMGITFKENVADIRNSKVINLVRELMDYSINVHITDPFASPNEVAREYKFSMVEELAEDYDSIIVAVNHNQYQQLDFDYFRSHMNSSPILFDLKAIYDPERKRKSLSAHEGDIEYWRL